VNTDRWSCPLPDEAQVSRLAEVMGKIVRPPLVIYLHGNLGAGKTTFARAYIRSLGYTGRVKSPTYGLLESYQAGGFQVLHLDLYRIEDGAELEYLALRDLFDSNTVLLIEWPDKGAGFLPPADLEMWFDETAGERHVKLCAASVAGAGVVQQLADFDGFKPPGGQLPVKPQK